MNMEPQQIFQLVSLLAVLALFSFSARGHIDYARWFRRWERSARRDATPNWRPKPANTGISPRATINPARAPGTDVKPAEADYSRFSSFSVRSVPHQPALNSARIALGS